MFMFVHTSNQCQSFEDRPKLPFLIQKGNESVHLSDRPTTNQHCPFISNNSSRNVAPYI